MIVMFIIPMKFILVCYLKIYKMLLDMAVVTTVHSPVTTCSSDSSTGVLYIHTHKSAPQKSQQAQSMIIRMLGQSFFPAIAPKYSSTEATVTTHTIPPEYNGVRHQCSAII
jgi:hypothetical protein